MIRSTQYGKLVSKGKTGTGSGHGVRKGRNASFHLCRLGPTALRAPPPNKTDQFFNLFVSAVKMSKGTTALGKRQ